MLKITGTHGYHMAFANGWNVSVQWCAGTYSSNRHHTIPNDATSAECGVWHRDDSADKMRVIGWMTPERIAALLARVAKRKTNPKGQS